MKIAVYTIALNEEKHVERWAASNVDADVRIIADTGSSDKTIELAKKNNVTVVSVSVQPFRFDVARNAALALVPTDVDVCIIQDMDEVLDPGFVQSVREHWVDGVHRGWVKLNTDVDWDADRVHARHGFRWVFPCHERCVRYVGPENSIHIPTRMTHQPDNSKSRGQYLGLLEMMAKEEPHNSRGWFYLGREYFYRDMKQEALTAFNEYLKIGTWNAERSATYRMMTKIDPDNSAQHVEKAVEEEARRESLTQAALVFYTKEDWNKCYHYSTLAVDADSPSDHFQEVWVTDKLIFDLAAISAYKLEKYDEALMYGLKAQELDPNDKRLSDNMKFYQEKVDGNIK